MSHAPMYSTNFGSMGVNPRTRVLAQAERANQLLHRELGVGLAHQNHAHARIELHEPAQGPERFGNSFVRLEITECADERRSAI